MYDHHSDRRETDSESSWFIDSTASARLISISSKSGYNPIQYYYSKLFSQSRRLPLHGGRVISTELSHEFAGVGIHHSRCIPEQVSSEYPATTRKAVIGVSVMPIGGISTQTQSRIPKKKKRRPNARAPVTRVRRGYIMAAHCVLCNCDELMDQTTS
jgi:hypothetical protein